MKNFTVRLFNNSLVNFEGKVFDGDQPFEAQLFEDVGASKIMKGFATLYDHETDLGMFTMSIDRSAFAESIDRGDDVVSLVNHNLDKTLGRTPGTLKLKWDNSHGLYCETLLPDHYLGDYVNEALERGDFNQMSVGFYILAEEMEKRENEKTHFHITKADLFDVSVVTFGQIPETSVEVIEGKFAGSLGTTQDLFDSLLSRHSENDERDPETDPALELFKLKNKHRSKLV